MSNKPADVLECISWATTECLNESPQHTCDNAIKQVSFSILFLWIEEHLFSLEGEHSLPVHERFMSGKLGWGRGCLVIKYYLGVSFLIKYIFYKYFEGLTSIPAPRLVSMFHLKGSRSLTESGSLKPYESRFRKFYNERPCSWLRMYETFSSPNMSSATLLQQPCVPNVNAYIDLHVRPFIWDDFPSSRNVSMHVLALGPSVATIPMAHVLRIA